MPAEARRAAIVEATLPLLLERGASVSTRQIAEAAGIAEGTIFRVFPDKDAVVQAAIEQAIDPAPTDRAIADIDDSASFDDQLVEAVRIMQARTVAIWQLLAVVGDGHKPKTASPPPELPSLARLLAAHTAELRTDPATAARQLRAVTLAVSHPAIYGDPLTPREIVALFLDGMRKR
jgi:AcrR family transcriptional regulator